MGLSFWNCAVLLGCFYLTADVGEALEFGYNATEQDAWVQHSKHCAGSFQSPIHIMSHRAVPMPLPAVEMIFYHNLLPGPLKLTNTGHSVSVEIVHQQSVRQLPQIFGARLPNPYELHSLHFHWGRRNSQGSEHILNGIKFPLEMHIIHWNTKYMNSQEAVRHKDGLTVLAFFFQVRERSNRRLDPILKSLKYVQHPHQEVVLNRTFTLASLLSSSIDVFYTYHGSLTTPPCFEVVTWIIFPDPLYMSLKQMNRKHRPMSSTNQEDTSSDQELTFPLECILQIKEFRKIWSRKSRMMNNFRKPQRLNNRTVYVRRI